MDYKEMNAIGIVRLMLTDGVITEEIAGKYFPELAMSEDERIRKDMIETIKKEAHDFPASVIAEKSNSWLSWLEKQAEQNPTWSEEDEYTLGETIQHLEELIRIDKAKHCACDVQYYQRDIDWLKSLKDR